MGALRERWFPTPHSAGSIDINVDSYSSGTLQIYSVDERDAVTATCVVRCVGGVVRAGEQFYLEAKLGGAGSTSAMTLDWINRYGQMVNLVDPPHNARVHLSGVAVADLERGVVLTCLSSMRGVRRLQNHEEVGVIVVAVAAVGVLVDVEGGGAGFIDQVKHPSWWDEGVSPPRIGERLHVVVLDAGREPARLSALQRDIEIAQRLRGVET